MKDNDTKRLSRLTAILIQLQTKRLITSTSLAEKFGVSVRTIYRDIKALEKAGVPIFTEDGKGYSLVEGYKIPPVAFSETEANALITVEQLVLNISDTSLAKAYAEAVSKIKAVLLYATKEKVDLLSQRIAISPALLAPKASDSLALIQHALTNFKVLELTYHSAHKNEHTKRPIEPFALYYSLEESWTLIAYCRLRKDYRMFRLDKIIAIQQSETSFKPHKLTLQEFLLDKQKKFLTPDIPLS